MLTIRARRLPWIDPVQARIEGQAAIVAMTAVLASYGSALLLEHLAHLHVDLVVQSVVLSLTLARTQRMAFLPDRLAGCLILPAFAMAADEVNTLVAHHPTTGDTTFVLLVSLSIWIRRFGPHAAKAGTTAVLPLVALLALQGPAGSPPGASHTGWAGLIGLIAATWVLAVQVGAGLLGFGEHPWPRRSPAPVRQQPPHAGGARARGRVRASTRMALQMAVALAAAFMVGRNAYPAHWTWVVLTAFIVCSGARGRADVVHKGLMRSLGAALGTIVATWIAGGYRPGDRTSVVLIFAVLALAVWLRKASYAFWAGGVTSVLSLLYGYFGESAPALLRTRLTEILIGAVIGMAASWFVLPVRTTHLLRRRVAEALTPLSDLLHLLGSGHWEAAEITHQRVRFGQGVALLDQLAPALRAQRTLVRLWASAPYRMDAIEAVQQCTAPVRALAAYAKDQGDTDQTQREESRQQVEQVKRTAAAVLANIGAVRRTIGRKPGDGYHPLPTWSSNETDRVGEAQVPAIAALAEIDRALGRLAASYRTRSPSPL